MVTEELIIEEKEGSEENGKTENNEYLTFAKYEKRRKVKKK